MSNAGLYDYNVNSSYCTDVTVVTFLLRRKRFEVLSLQSGEHLSSIIPSVIRNFINSTWKKKLFWYCFSTIAFPIPKNCQTFRWTGKECEWKPMWSTSDGRLLCLDVWCVLLYAFQCLLFASSDDSDRMITVYRITHYPVARQWLRLHGPKSHCHSIVLTFIWSPLAYQTM